VVFLVLQLYVLQSFMRKGVFKVPSLERTEDNFERTFQSNHLGHFALTALLFPMLSKSEARVVNVSSGAHWIARRGIDMENLNGEKSYDPWKSYGASKLANILFTRELQRRVQDSSGGYSNFKAFSLTPGLTRTDIFRYFSKENNYVSMMDERHRAKRSGSLITFVSSLIWSYFSISVERGATTQIWLASGKGDDLLHGGEYLYNCKVGRTASAGMSEQLAKQLWQISEKISGVVFNV
jgi:NAD(P)-dependent dehydrogenase (short-subunit alcohol dehydrogenase family)